MGGAYAWHWHTHPVVFPDAGNAWSGPLREGRDFMTVGITASGTGEGEVVVIESVAPLVLTNTAGATHEFYVCTQLEEKGEMQLGILSRPAPARRPGSSGRSCAGRTRLRTAGSPRQQLVMVVRLDEPAVAATRGGELTCASGLQRGTQLIGPRVRITSG